MLLLVQVQVYGQLTTSTSMTPTQLVENVLVGSGVAVSNVMYNGHPEAIGSFTGTGTNLGLSNGILLTTGTVLNSGGFLEVMVRTALMTVEVPALIMENPVILRSLHLPEPQHIMLPFLNLILCHKVTV
ncbi:MAG: choice-of-anchor L domain-containing protein [Crocinitomicaceae bacterium]|nr:choice-of-anchor L domain-containing protein [Crocinitomicaceae bacterium]